MWDRFLGVATFLSSSAYAAMSVAKKIGSRDFAIAFIARSVLTAALSFFFPFSSLSLPIAHSGLVCIYFSSFSSCAFMASFILLARIVVPLYTQSSDSNERLIIVLVLHPLITGLSLLFIRMASNRLKRLEDVTNRFMLLTFVRIFYSSLWRLFLVNMSNLRLQVSTIVIFAVVGVILRLTSPLHSYIFWLVTTRSKKKAWREAEESRTAELNVHHTYMIHFVEIFSILFAFSFTISARFYYDLPQDSLITTFLSIILQLVAEIVSDMVAIKFEESYLERSLLSLWTFFNFTYLRTLIPLLLISSIYPVREYAAVVQSAGLG